MVKKLPLSCGQSSSCLISHIVRAFVRTIAALAEHVSSATTSIRQRTSVGFLTSFYSVMGFCEDFWKEVLLFMFCNRVLETFEFDPSIYQNSTVPRTDLPLLFASAGALGLLGNETRHLT